MLQWGRGDRSWSRGAREPGADPTTSQPRGGRCARSALSSSLMLRFPQILSIFLLSPEILAQRGLLSRGRPPPRVRLKPPGSEQIGLSQ